MSENDYESDLPKKKHFFRSPKAVAAMCGSIVLLLTGFLFFLSKGQSAFATQFISPITVHVVTHSHLDAGWVYDVDRCYETVHNVFTSVFEELLLDDAKTYTVGDLYFF